MKPSGGFLVSGSMGAERPIGTLEAVCPMCGNLMMCRTSHIDECGFEQYRFECQACHVRLTGIGDPYDGEVLIEMLS